jgi:tetratricopeptide (TPR) repeat protein
MALKIYPDNEMAWFAKGYALLKLGRYEESIEAFNSALRINPVNAIPWSYKGLSLDKLGRHKEALNAYQQSLKIDPTDTDVLKLRDEVKKKIHEQGKKSRASKKGK